MDPFFPDSKLEATVEAISLSAQSPPTLTGPGMGAWIRSATHLSPISLERKNYGIKSSQEPCFQPYTKANVKD